MADKEKKTDDIDDKIIKILRINGRISMRELGAQVHLTGQAAKNRVEHLEDLGIVQKYTIKVDCPVYGYKVHAIIKLQQRFPTRRPSVASSSQAAISFYTAIKQPAPIPISLIPISFLSMNSKRS